MALSLTINGILIQAEPGPSLFDFAERAGIKVPTSCQKQGKCKECLMEIVAGMDCLSAPTDPEKHLKPPFRLSCQTRVTTDTGEIRCHTMRRGQMRIERSAVGLPPGLQKIDPALRREITQPNAPIHGLAMDLGTTTVVLRLYNLETGALIADSSFENPQRFGGSDVMSRIFYDTTNTPKLLMRTLAGYLTHAIEEFPVDPKTIYEMVVVGNSTMRDLFFRQNVYSIGQNPYRSITEIELAEGKRTTTSLADTARRCLLPIHPEARVYGAPIISGHVGADAAACMLAVNLAHEDRLIAIMDIGTNTELILGNRHRILAASCPAGPAFEGGAISCGMPALDGAIESIKIDDTGAFHLGVISPLLTPAPGTPGEGWGGGSPQLVQPPAISQGICGSGLIELLSELLRTNRMNELGRFTHGESRITIDAAHNIHFLESDVSELAQAKGANVAGLQTVFHNFGVDFDDIDIFYLAGGFGRHINIDAARRIGLIPNLPNSKIVQVGNAAIEGAAMALLSASKRAELEQLVKKVEHCRLETHPRFFDFFVEGCQFKPVEAVTEVEA